MTCEHCGQRTADALIGVDGVEDATADHEAKRVAIEDGAGTDAFVATVEDTGYDASA